MSQVHSLVGCCVCNQSGHVAGTECLDCCGICGSKKDNSGSCLKGCQFKDFWDIQTVSSGVPVMTWKEEVNPTIIVQRINPKVSKRAS